MEIDVAPPSPRCVTRYAPLATALGPALVAMLALSWLIIPVLTIAELPPRLYNEGWNAYHAARAAAGDALYDRNLWRIDNYPFLSFYLIGWLGPALGGVVIAGRILSLASLMVMAACGGIAVRQLGGGKSDALWGAAAVLGFYCLQAPAWVAADEPETLAHAFMMLGLVIYLANRSSPAHLVATALFLGLGGFTKHNLVALPMAISLDILVASRRRFLIWCLCSTGVVAGLLGASQLLAGGGFVGRLLLPRGYGLRGALYHGRKFLILFKLPLLVSAFHLGWRAPGPQRVLLPAYGIIAIATSLLFAGGEGTSYNIFLDPVIFLGIAGALALSRLRAALPGRALGLVLQLVLPLILVQPMLTHASERMAPLFHLHRVLAATRAASASYAAAAAYLAAQPGPAICEDYLLCFRAAKPLLVDPFNAYQLIRAGRLDERELLGWIAAQRFGAIVLSSPIYPDPISHPGEVAEVLRRYHRFTESFLQAVDRFYRVDRIIAGNVFYLPSPGASNEARPP